MPTNLNYRKTTLHQHEIDVLTAIVRLGRSDRYTVVADSGYPLSTVDHSVSRLRHFDLIERTVASKYSPRATIGRIGEYVVTEKGAIVLAILIGKHAKKLARRRARAERPSPFYSIIKEYPL